MFFHNFYLLVMQYLMCNFIKMITGNASENDQNFITKEEGESMIRGFNKHLKKLSAQLDQLQLQNKAKFEKFEKESFHNSSLRNSIHFKKFDLDKATFSISQASEKLSTLESLLTTQSSPISLHKISEADFQLNFLEYTEYLSQLEKNSVILQTEKELLQMKIKESEESAYIDLKCLYCKKLYKAAENYKEACRYHKGGLRYFSCRGCGGDAYYQCCNKCTECSAGCIITHHRS